MDGMGSAIRVVKNRADKDGVEDQEAYVESLDMSFKAH